MDTLQELIQRTEWLQHQVEELRQTVDRLHGDLAGHREALVAQLGAPGGPEALVASDDEEPEPMMTADQEASGSNRRSLPRRRGNPIPVLIRRSATDPENMPGWVIDRSPEGLCLLADQQVSVGALLSVRPTYHAEGLQWFPVRVQNCRLERSAWILGCRFVEELSWDELRLFN